MDNFHEQLEVTGGTLAYKIMNFSVYFFGALTLACITLGQLILTVISIALAVIFFIFKKNAYVEYEYDFTNGELDVDAIYEQKKRKRLLTINVKDIELLAEEESYYVKDFSNKPEKILTCYPKTSDKKVYVAMVTGGVERLQLRFTPDSELLELCMRYNPRAVKR